MLNATDVETLDYSYQGQPFVLVCPSATIDTQTLDYSYQGQPFVATPNPVVAVTNNVLFFGCNF